jgi:hypothetical protein
MLREVQVTLKENFPPVVECLQWLRNPFIFPLTEQGLLTEQYEELINISKDMGFKDTYTNVPLIKLRSGLKEEFPLISSVAVKKLLPFPSTYLCATAFSRYVATETKYRNPLVVERDMRIQLTKVVPDFNCLWKASRPTLRIR